MKGTKGLNNVRAKGELTVIHIDKDGKELARDIYKNLVVDTGKNVGIQQIVGAAGGGAQPAKFNYIGIGTDDTAPAAGDTVLGTQVGTREQDTDPSFPSTGKGEIEVTFAAGNGTGTIEETGLFNAAGGGTMYARALIGPYVKAAEDALIVTWRPGLL
ncbi:MAG: hypothetical protein JRE23_00205 [Deltaproteobacteria bacterium]|nr:hypothetical protein [Deltaproteobacteria bacterium]